MMWRSPLATFQVPFFELNYRGKKRFCRLSVM
jgi:hypothetical protein